MSNFRIPTVPTIASAFPAEHKITDFVAHTAGNNGTLIAVILDESGSMMSCRDATINGFNEFLQGQRQATNAGEAYLTLVKFDAPYIHTVCNNTPINDFPLLNTETYCPNGGTNLFDAIGITLNKVNSVLASVPQNERPGVICVIVTDGQENSSREFTGQQIKSMVKTAEASDWTFQFLGANVDAFSMGATFGMTMNNSVNFSTNNIGATINVLTNSVSRTRSAKMAGMSTAEIYNQGLYTSEEIDILKGK